MVSRSIKKTRIKPYYFVKRELFIAYGLLFKSQIVIPEVLQPAIVKAAHRIGHFGITTANY